LNTRALHLVEIVFNIDQYIKDYWFCYIYNNRRYF